MWALARLGGRSLDEVFDLDLPGRTALPGLTALLAPNRQLGAAVLLLVLAALGSFAIANRVEEEPARTPLTAFPLKLGDWRGTESDAAAASSSKNSSSPTTSWPATAGRG